MAGSSSTSPRGFTSWSPVLKLVAWAIVVMTVSGIVHGACLIFDVPFRPFSHEGRDFVNVLAMLGLINLAMIDGRPLTEYGLAFDDRWRRQLWTGYFISIVVVGAYVAMLVLTGTMGPRESASWVALAHAIWLFYVAIIASFIKVLLFTGYVQGIMTRAAGPIVGILSAAVLWGVVHHAGEPWAIVGDDLPKFIGLVLFAVFLGLLRLLTGNIMVSVAAFAGYIFIERLNHLTRLAREQLDNDLLAILSPDRDMLQSPVAWAVLAVGIASVGVMLVRKGPAEPPERGSIPAPLKRMYPLGMINVMAPIDVWCRQLAASRFRVPFDYWARMIFALGGSTISTVINLPERLLAPVLLRGVQVPDPVFILGVHRSGTTHLHNLLALDPQFTVPRNVHVMNPTGFRVLGWLFVPVIAGFLPWRRPMDGVRFHLFTPNEEEFALMNMGSLSPHWGMTFPTRWPEYDTLIRIDLCSEADRARWCSQYMTFLRKLVWLRGRRPLLKNPYNTARVATLRELFPDARFVHIARHPFSVVRSNRHLAEEGHCLMQLQDPVESVSYPTRFLENYRIMEDACHEHTADLPGDRIVRIRFEQLEQDPIGVVEQIYRALDLELSDAFRHRLERYVASIAGYRKNVLREVAEDEATRIRSVMGPFMDRWGYE